MSLRSTNFLYVDLYHDGQVDPRDSEGVMADMAWITHHENPEDFLTHNCLKIGYIKMGYKTNQCDKKKASREQWCLT